MKILSQAGTFFCHSNRASRKESSRKEKKSERFGEKKKRMIIVSSIRCKALLMAKMISWRKVVAEDGDDGAVWKRNIVKGQKCQPWDFSGQISYDSNGVRVLGSH
ncbi:unnamed protein product [Cuscuta epithymum]|uniref:Uncharacterized protein n=1 Tax=Cuscuta epithymum TaxID=186058 RepID=A0AAV0DB16_9ASTE|nr:unnamed protein product [Cuscuta epithymum]